MAHVIVSLLAQLDEVQIARDLAREAGPRTAAKYVALFGGLYVRLGDHPESGAPRRSLGPRVRIGVVYP
jgi:plasmid stabilization system protein ParE